MITNFEELTEELSSYEKEIVLPFVKLGLEKKRGKSNIITNKQMVAGLKKNNNIEIIGPRLRKIIQALRMSGSVECLIATSRGYYIAETKQELDNYIESLLQRADTTYALANQLQYQLKNHKNKLKT